VLAYRANFAEAQALSLHKKFLSAVLGIAQLIDSSMRMSYDKRGSMGIKKLVFLILLLSLVGSLLFSQTLAEIAKKERERRENLKGKKAVVVTNADLARLKKKPALEIPPAPPEPQLEEQAEQATPSPAEETLGSSGPTASPQEGESEATLKTLQVKWEKAKEYVELLTLKMSALWQQFYGLDNLSSKEAVQQAIAETFIKLQDAQTEETTARQELEKFLSQIKKESAPSLWIR
jgi:Na+-transporting NADH:ubiquinone oxidoreductase subunit NqrC